MRILTTLALACVFAACAAPSPAASRPWLFVTDIHFDPASRDPHPVSYGDDTNEPLLASALAAMKRADPDPPVVVIDGDFLAHDFDYARAAPTMAALARRFDRAFPRAQFVVSLGNEDSGCSDYGVAAGAPFLRAAARAWEPLVNRRGAAPGFARTFARDGSYTAALPVPGLRAVVIDDVYWSPRYRACPGGSADPGGETARELRAALEAGHGTSWVVAHIPPGIDAFSTVFVAHRVAVVPFLDPGPRDAFLAAVEAPSHRVALVVAAHTHKFSYRIGDAGGAHPVPFLMVPSISPIFGNAPSFLTVDVGAGGTVANAVETSYLHGRWQRIGDLRELGLSAFTGPALVGLQARLTRDSALRRRYARLYQGGAYPEINDRTWPAYRCAAVAFTSSTFRACAGIGGFSILTGRGLVLGGILAACVLGAAGAAVWILRFRRRPRKTA